MTSITSYQNATTAGNYTLVHSGVTIPQSITVAWVDDYKSIPELQTQVALRQNFWSSQVVMDGRNPAVIWRHEFKMYVEVNSLATFEKMFYDLQQRFQTDPTTLLLVDGDRTTVRRGFGPAYLEDASLDNPTTFLQHRAGFIRLNFVSATQPTFVG